MDRWVSALRLPDDSIVSDPADLCSSFSDFYSSLYSTSETDASAQEALHANLPTPLPPEQSDLCEGLLSAEECHLALVGMAKGKAPGSDGLPAECYCKFWDLLGPDLVEVLNFCFNFGSLFLSQRRGVISLLFVNVCCKWVLCQRVILSVSLLKGRQGWLLDMQKIRL